MRFPDAFPCAICRPESSSPATGSPGSHRRDWRQLIEKALAE